jgi:type II secretory pathway component GspD/PulD (secretin)
VLVRNLTHLDHTTCLLAGQHCTFNNVKNSPGGMLAIHPSRPSANKAATLNSHASGSLEENDSEMLFNNESLPVVFSRLSEFYRSPIRFDHAEMNKRTFTGSIQKDRSLEDALKLIMLLNRLHVDKKDGVFRIMPGR